SPPSLYPSLFILLVPRPPPSPLFPYTTLFRSLMQQADRFRRYQGRLLGRLRDNAVAGDQRCAHLAQEDRERKIPRRDRDEHAASAQAQHIALAGWTGHRFALVKQPAAFARVIAAEIGGLAHLGERIVECLAALALQECDEMRFSLFQEVCGFLEAGGPPTCRRCAPVFKSRRRRGSGRMRQFRRSRREA